MLDDNAPLFSLTVCQFKELVKSLLINQKPIKKELPKFLSPAQLSDLTNWKLTTVYQNNYNGLIPGAKKMGGRLLFETEVILAWIEENAIPTKEEKKRAIDKRMKI